MNIELLTPAEGERTWRIRITRGQDRTPGLPMATDIVLWAPTQDVVKKLRRMYKGQGVRITAPDGTTISPKPPGGYPQIHSAQPSRQ